MHSVLLMLSVLSVLSILSVLSMLPQRAPDQQLVFHSELRPDRSLASRGSHPSATTSVPELQIYISWCLFGQFNFARQLHFRCYFWSKALDTSTCEVRFSHSLIQENVKRSFARNSIKTFDQKWHRKFNCQAKVNWPNEKRIVESDLEDSVGNFWPDW